MKHADLAPDGSLARAPYYESRRKGESFWKVASDHGLHVKSLLVPFAYPAESLGEGSCELCGLDAPDIRGTQSTYFALSEDFTAPEAVAGGMRLPIRFQNGQATIPIPGIAIPGKPDAWAEAPVTLRVDRTAGKVAIEVQGQKATLAAGEWSEWLEWTFAISSQYSVRAISRFHCMDAGKTVRLYMTCLQMHPRAPMAPISAPEGYAGELADRYGLFKTIGWAYDTKALQQHDLTEEIFLEDVRRTMAWDERLVLDEVDRGGFDLLVAGWTAPDRVSHLFWAYRDPKHPLYTEALAKKYGRVVEETYGKMDTIVGEVMQRLGEQDLLMLLSDHGFHSFRYGFGVNTWLVRNGYLTVKGQSDPATAFTDQKYLRDYDWSKTKAYGIGLGMVFLNLKGREGEGVVDPSDAPALLAEIREKLLQVHDPKTGDKVFSEVYLMGGSQGESALDAPDLQLAYAEGYQTAKASASGATPKNLFEPNLDAWSGEHAASDPHSTCGIFFANRPVSAEPALTDLGVTALGYLGVGPPKSFQGKPLL
jgi:predicted AlkP superfamily phosphohydrolase/phosphomutase